MNGSPAAWHRVAGEHCDGCRAKLGFLEGPLCDKCAEEEREVGAGADRYALWREDAIVRLEVAMPVPRVAGGCPFAIDLASGEFVT